MYKKGINFLVAKNVKTYREAAGYSQEVLAKKAYIPFEVVESIENGLTFSNEFYYFMKIAETLGLTYYDFFEHVNGRIASRNLHIPQEAVNKIFDEIEKKKITKEDFCKAVGTKHNSIWYWKDGGVPNPFLFYNATQFLGMNADSFKDVIFKKIETKKVQAHMMGWIDEREREKPVGLDEVIKACQVYQKLDSVISQLDAIIKTATDLKAELEKERA